MAGTASPCDPLEGLDLVDYALDAALGRLEIALRFLGITFGRDVWAVKRLAYAALHFTDGFVGCTGGFICEFTHDRLLLVDDAHMSARFVMICINKNGHVAGGFPSGDVTSQQSVGRAGMTTLAQHRSAA